MRLLTGLASWGGLVGPQLHSPWGSSQQVQRDGRCPQDLGAHQHRALNADSRVLGKTHQFLEGPGCRRFWLAGDSHTHST